jgi:putative MATE family efflux protein
VVFTVGCFFFPEKILGIYSTDPEVIRVGSVYLHTLSLSFIPYAIGQVFFLSLRSIEKLTLPMYCTFAALGINAVLNYLLIFGIGIFPALGVQGAAIGTVCARMVEMLLLVGVSYAKKYAPAGPLREMTAFNRVYVSRFFRVCIPVILNEVVWAGGVAAQNIIFARTGTEAMAAFNITNTFSQLTWAAFIGLGNGVAILIGKKIGAGDHAGARDYAARIIRFAPLLACGAALVLLPLAHLLPLIFKVDQAVLAMAAFMFILLSISYPLKAFNMSMVIGICRAGGDTVFCSIFDTIFMWLIALPLATVASFIFHISAPLVFGCILVEEVFKFLAGLWRYRSEKWLHNVVEGI